MRVAEVATDSTSSLFRRATRHSGLRYLVVGGTSFLVDIGMLALLHEVILAPLWLATAVAFLVSFVFNYTLQRTIAFRGGGSHTRSLLRYGALLAFNTLATVAVVTAFDVLVGWGVGKIVATTLTTIWTYFVYRYWVFRNDN